MSHRTDRRTLLAGLGVAGALTLARTARAQTCGDPGQLGPSGPTMRDLSRQISRGPEHPAETGIALASLAGSATAQFVIDEPGEYYLSGPITGVPFLNCIEILASHVQIDFRGWTIFGVPNTRSGIVAPLTQTNIEIHGASFDNWQGSCINLANCSNCLCNTGWFRGCNGAGSSGTDPGVLALGPRGCIDNCDQFDCQGSLMSVGQQGEIYESLSAGGSGSCFQCGDGGVIENCFALQNGGFGVLMGPHSTLTLSRIMDNDGVVTALGGVVFDCEISRCTTGVTVGGGGNEIEDNYLCECPTGISVGPAGARTLVDLNHVVGSQVGIVVDAAASRNLVTRNQVTVLPGGVGFSLGSAAHGTIRDVTAGGDIGAVGAQDNLLY